MKYFGENKIVCKQFKNTKEESCNEKKIRNETSISYGIGYHYGSITNT